MEEYNRSINDISDEQLNFWISDISKSLAKNPNDKALIQKKLILDFEKERRAKKSQH